MKKILLVILGMALVHTGVVFLYLRSEKRKVVYADAVQLFNGYKFKTDMENSSKGALEQLKHEVDSVSVMYKVDPQNTQVQQLVMAKQQRLQQGYEQINKEINEKVWSRLNTVIQEFGREQGIDLLIGANGMGTVLYASDKRDVTQDLIKYANKLYEKGN